MKFKLVSFVTDEKSAVVNLFQEGADLPVFKLRLVEPEEARGFEESELQHSLADALFEIRDRRIARAEAEARRIVVAEQEAAEAAEAAAALLVPPARETVPDHAEEITVVEKVSKDALVSEDPPEVRNEPVLPSETPALVPASEPAAGAVEAVVTPEA